MALKGAGDPRWIVEEREDGRNLNGWHWEEAPLLPWAKQRIPELLVGSVPLPPDVKEGTTLQVSKVVHVKGEASAEQRKGRRFCLYELEVKLAWKLKRAGIEAVVEGEANMPYIADENDKDEFDIDFKIEKGSADAKREALDMVRKPLDSYIRAQIVSFLTEMLAEHATAKELKQMQDDQAKAAAEEKKRDVKEDLAAEVKSGGRTINMEVRFRGIPPPPLYEMLLDVNRVRAFTQSDAMIERRVGGKFSMFGGNVSGTIVKMEENRMIEQLWRFRNWPAFGFSAGGI